MEWCGRKARAERRGVERFERAGVAPAEELDRTDKELDVLRHITGVAEHIF